MDTELIEITKRVRRELADFLGVDPEDIEPETVLREDLHMDPSNLTDFADILGKAGFEAEKVDLSQIETFEELVEALASHV